MNKLTLHLIRRLSGIDVELLQSDMETLQTKNQQLSFEIKDANKEAAFKKAQLAETQNELAASQQEITALQNTVTSLQQEISELQHNITALQQEKETDLNKLRAATEEGIVQESKISRLESDLQEARTKASLLEKSKEETEQQMTKAKEERDTLQTQCQKQKAESQALQAELTRLKGQIQEQTAEINEQSLKRSLLKNESQAVSASLKQTETEQQALVNAYTTLRKEHERFRKMYAEQEEKNKEKDRNLKDYASLKQEFEEMRRALSASKEETRRLNEERILSAKRTEEIQSSLQAALSERQKVQKEYELLQQTTGELKGENLELQKEMSALQARLTEAQSDSSTLLSQFNELQKKNAALLQEKERLTTENQSLLARPGIAGKQIQTPKEKEEGHETEKKEPTAAPAENEAQETVPEKTVPSPQSPADRPAADEPHRSPTSHPETGREEQTADIVRTYQDMKAKLERSTLNHPYTRITTETDGSQYIYESRTLGLKAELFIWGVEGKEIVRDASHFIPYNEIANIEGLDTPFASDTMNCDFSEEGNATEVAEALLTAICGYKPLHIVYRDKNGRISERNLYWICFRPEEGRMLRLPHERIFQDMFDGNIDTDHLVAMCAHAPEPRIFTINQIISLRIFDAFSTTERGIGILIDGLYSSLLAMQPEAADMIYRCMPDKFKTLPCVIANRAHYWMLEGEYQKAVELYLSVPRKEDIGNGMTWEAANAADFNEFIRRDIEAERFSQLKEALEEQGWEL